MNLAQHCDLCDHQNINLKDGTICSLTSKKPEFNIVCSKIELNEKFKNRLKNVNIEYEKLNRNNTIIYTYFYVLLSIGILVIIGGYLLGKYIFDAGVISPVPIIVIGAGITLMGMAIGTVRKHLQELEAAKIQKNKIDDVLSLYKIDYKLKILFGKEIHGKQEIQIDLKFKGKNT